MRRRKLAESQEALDRFGTGETQASEYTKAGRSQRLREETAAQSRTAIVRDYITHCRSCPECGAISEKAKEKLRSAGAYLRGDNDEEKNAG